MVPREDPLEIGVGAACVGGALADETLELAGAPVATNENGGEEGLKQATHRPGLFPTRRSTYPRQRSAVGWVTVTRLAPGDGGYVG
jgi:hypothetical protein